jgi:nitrate/nitrite transporter NarK
VALSPVAGVALLGSYLTVGRSFWWAFIFPILAGSAMYTPYGPFFAIMPEILPKSVAGEVTALVNSCGALGAFLGTWCVGLLQAYTGNSRAGFLLMSLSLMLAGLITLGLRESANNSPRALSSNPVSAEAG